MSETPSGNPLEPTIDHTRTADAVTTIPPEAPGYLLFERVGVGGMGEVYHCGDDALDRDLAIKVIKQELHGDPVAEERFLREARLTGSLQHPGIVPIHQLGRLADGRPYYTMKLIRGRTFADMLRHEPSGPERLPRLLAVVEKVCQAVAYAHSRGVIHRDLKPANVMVGEFGEVQVMDWGLAKELSRIETVTPTEVTEIVETMARVEEAAGLSRAGAALGTPHYMPPEQAAGDWEIVDERADVFALGAILCQVLTGRPPYYGGPREEVLRLARLGDAAEALGRLQQCSTDTAIVQLVRDCLAPQRQSRPRNASAVEERLAAYEATVQERLRQAELERVAAEVRAREAQARAAAELRAKWLLLGMAAVVVIVVLLGAVGLAIGMLRLRAEQQRTQQALDQVKAEQKNTQAAWKQTREALSTLTDDVMEELLGKQAVLGEKEKAYLRKALGFYQRFAVERGEDEESRAVAAEGQFRVAKLRAFLGENAEAEAGYRAAVRLHEKLAGDFPSVPEYRQHLASSHNNLGNLLRDLGRRTEAESAFHTALRLYEKLAGDYPAVPLYRSELAASHNNLGNLLRGLGKSGEAESAYRQALTLKEKLVGEFPAVSPYRMDLALSHNNLGVLLAALGKSAEAEAAFRAACKGLEKLVAAYPAEPQYRQKLAASHNNLGLLLDDLGRRAEAEMAHRQALALREKLTGDFPAVPQYRQELAESHNNLGLLLAGWGKIPEAEAAYRTALTWREKLVADFPAVPAYCVQLAGTCVNLGELLRRRGQPQAALDWYGKAMPLLQSILGQDARGATARLFLGNAHSARARALGQLGRHAEAAKDWLQASQLEDGVRRSYYRLRYVAALAHAGDHRAAVKAVEQLLASSAQGAEADRSAPLLYDAACVYALSAAGTKDDASLREQYAVRAIALLRQAQKAGFFKDPKQIDNMRKDADLDALRKREDFKKLLAEFK